MPGENALYQTCGTPPLVCHVVYMACRQATIIPNTPPPFLPYYLSPSLPLSFPPYLSPSLPFLPSLPPFPPSLPFLPPSPSNSPPRFPTSFLPPPLPSLPSFLPPQVIRELSKCTLADAMEINLWMHQRMSLVWMLWREGEPQVESY